MGLWQRLCIDVDDRGNSVGWSVETHRDEVTIQVTTGSLGPFDGIVDALELVLAEGRRQRDLRLF